MQELQSSWVQTEQITSDLHMGTRMFNLKSPCNNCPFRKGHGKNFRLSKERLDGIFNATAFQCHKTVDYSEGANSGNNPNQCAGLMAVLYRSGRPNQIMQVAERLGYLDLKSIDQRQEAYGNIEEAYKAHTGQIDNIKR